MHQQEAEKEQKNRELLEKRIQAVKSLKSNIAATQVSNLPYWDCSVMVVVLTHIISVVKQKIIQMNNLSTNHIYWCIVYL